MFVVRFPLQKVYPITDASLPDVSVQDQVAKLVSAGARLIQLRAKDLNDRDLFEAALEAADLTRKFGCRLIINDRVDIARLCGADGVHLGQMDLSPVAARELLGPQAIIGYSTHSIEQVHKAVKLPIDYVAFGPIFETMSKRRADPVVGLETLVEVKSHIGDLPLVAIGGIRPDSIEDVLRSGADSAAMISGLWGPPGEVEPQISEYFE